MSTSSLAMSVLEDLGWERLAHMEGEQGAGVTGILEREYARVAVLEAADVAAVERTWLDAQALVAEVKERDPFGWWRDYYLLILVDADDGDAWDALRAISNNTFVCRKLCEVVGAKSVQKLLESSPVLNPEGTAVVGLQGSSHLPGELSSSTGIPSDLLDDLSLRSKERILRKLLEGAYDDGRTAQ